MSRKFRLEDERSLKVKESYEEEVKGKLQARHERTAAPLVWKRMGIGFRIEDAQEKHFNEILEIIKEHYIPNEVLCKNTKLEKDEVSLNAYLERLLGHLKNMNSIITVDEKFVEPGPEGVEDEEEKKQMGEKIKIAGVLILRVVPKLDYGRVFSREQLIKGDAMKACVSLRAHISKKVDVYAKYNCDSILRYYDLCVLPEYRKKGLGYQMMLSGLDVARSLGVPVVMGLFNTYSLQKLAKRMEMATSYEMSYVDWRDSGGDLIFGNPGTGNYTCALMAEQVPPLPFPEPPKLVVESGTKKGAKADKKADKKKK